MFYIRRGKFKYLRAWRNHEVEEARKLAKNMVWSHKMLEKNITTNHPKEVVDLTDELNSLLADREDDGLLYIHALHTTVALSVADLDPGAEEDMLEAFYKMIPKLNFRHPHNPAHMPDHILSALIGNSLTWPVQAGRLSLGTWQRVVLFEFNGPRARKLLMNFQSVD